MHKLKLKTDSIIFRSLLDFHSDEVLFPIRNGILLNPLSVLVYPLFH